MSENGEKNNEVIKNKKYAGKHVRKKILLIPLLLLMAFIIFNIFKSADPKASKKEQIEKVKDNKMNKKENPFQQGYEDQEVTDVIKTNNNLKMDEKNINNEFVNEMSPEEIERRKSFLEEARNARRSSIGFQIQNKIKEPQVLGEKQNKVYGDYDLNRQGSKKSFLENETANNFYLGSSLTPPISPYEVKAGDFIPAVMITQINSDLPSKVITAQVRENIFDTVTGNNLLIPQGTKMIGTYDSNVSWGQKRLLIIWQRAILPNGNSIALDNMQGIDLTGQAGITGKVNNHFATLLKGVLLSSAVGASAAIVTNDEDDWKSEAGQGAGESIVNIGNKFAEKALERQPTIVIKQGERFNIMVHSDMILKPYR